MSDALVWFRRDLRLNDHAAMQHALVNHDRVHCVFIVDPNFITTLLAGSTSACRRAKFMFAALMELDALLRQYGGGMIVRHGAPHEVIPSLAAELGVASVYVNREYEPHAIERDEAVSSRLAAGGRELRTFKDQVIFECDEVVTQSGTPFSVFTPYKNAWSRRLSTTGLSVFETEPYLHHLVQYPIPVLQALKQLDVALGDRVELNIPTGMRGAQRLFRDFIERIDAYAEWRDFPAANGPSCLSAHLRFGTISIRQLVAYAQAQPGLGAQAWLSELIWREFYQMVLWHHPQVVDRAFKPACDALVWDDAPELFAAWCDGSTGYPLVDAAMRQLNQSGHMHNRLRMVAASFLVKDLGIDWRRGERYFAERLIDYDLAANNGGWQWVASTGCDAQPWFRIFNPVKQSEKFDAQGKFIRSYVPELAQVPDRQIHAPWKMRLAEQQACGIHIGSNYPAPIVDHSIARARTLERYGALDKR